MEKQNGIDLKVHLGSDATGERVCCVFEPTPHLVTVGHALGEKVYLDFEKYPHLVCIGASGSGKSLALHRMIDELCKNNSPEQVRLFLIDSKVREFPPIEGEFLVWKESPHLFAPVVMGAEAGREAMTSLCRLVRERIEGRAPKDSHLFVFIDEVLDMVREEGNQECVDAINTLVKEGAKANVHLVMVTLMPRWVFAPNRVSYEAFPYHLVGRLSDKVDSLVHLGNEEAAMLRGYCGDMILATSTDQTHVYVLRAGE